MRRAYTGHMGPVRALPLRIAILAAAVLWALMALPGCVAPAGDIIAGVRASAAHDSFNIAVWELRHASDIVAALNTPPENPDAIDEYFETTARLREATGRAEWLLANRPSDDPELLEALEQEEAIERDLEDIRARATLALRGLTMNTMREAGLVSDPPVLGDIVFPPVSFVMEELPKALAVSPRNRIELMESLPLRPDISTEEIRRLEQALSDRGLSALVVNIGGMGTYPALVKATSTREFTVRTILHEWVHHYLFFHPLGQRYGAGGDMTTINETVANMVAAETAAIALDQPPPVFRVPEPPTETHRDPGVFEFGAYMRETRVEAERLLADGLVGEAETYMEERRVHLNETHGYAIRKINQAYFAFHGSYADSPAGGTVSPIYGQLIEVRNQAGSVAEFLRTVREIKSPADLEQLAGAG